MSFDDADEAIATARRLRMEAAAHCATSRARVEPTSLAVVSRTHELCHEVHDEFLRMTMRVAAARHLRPLHGASSEGCDALGTAVADVATAIAHASLCWRCLCSKAGLAPQRGDAAMAAVRRVLVVRLSVAPCEGCYRDTLIYRLG